MRRAARSRRATLIAVVVSVLMSTACSITAGDPELWDLRTPVTAFDLGGDFSDVHGVGSGTLLTVIFPSGRTLELEHGAYAQVDDSYRSTAESPLPISEIVTVHPSARTADELLAEFERFESEWGPVHETLVSPIELIDDFDTFLRLFGDDHDFFDFLNMGNHVRTWTAAEQDGITPSWHIDVGFDSISVRWRLDFDPPQA